MDVNWVAQLVDAIKDSGEAHTLEIVYWLSQIGLFGVVSITAVFARDQLRSLKQSRIDALHIAHAEFLLALDTRWDGAEMTACRSAIIKLRDSIHDEVAKGHPQAADARRNNIAGEKFSEKLQEIREQKFEEYQVLMRICGFFETAGLMVKRGYVKSDDIVSLFKGPILVIDTCYRKNIDLRSQETGVPNGMYEHALFLCEQANKT